ncbi:MAG: Calx-beta domain-containing protein, partial [Anaerolineae bacterium]
MKKLIVLLALISLLVPLASLSPRATSEPEDRYFQIRTVTAEDGAVLVATLINGPPVGPVGRPRPTPQMDRLDGLEGTTILADVPAFNWSFGCSATSAAMIAGYYDRTGYANMYTGPTNGGVMPLDNSTWPDWQDSSGDWRHQCPLSATHGGLDGRSGEGHVDDYWVAYGDNGPDPLGDDGAEHTYGDCTADYMKTNQSAYGNVDGGTTFWHYGSGNPLYCSDMVDYGIDNDGGHGLQLFYEARGYSVTDCYNQYIQGQGDNPLLGFTFDQYKAEIDAGRPVMIHLRGHTVVGVGYDDASDQIYLHDTWDYVTHTMPWGGTYADLQHYAVTIVRLVPVAAPPAAPSDLVATAAGSDQIDLTWTDNATNESGFGIERSPDAADWSEIASLAADVTSYQDTGLAPSTTHYYRVHAYNDAGASGYSNEAGATTDDVIQPQISFSSPSYTAYEAGGTATLTVTLSEAAPLTATIDYEGRDGTATAGDDFMAISGTLTFTPGSITQLLPVTILNDTLDEIDETLFLTLTHPTSATLGLDNTQLTITDDDPLPSLSVSDSSADEIDSHLTFTASLSAASGRDVSVDYTTSDGSAIAGQDYSAATGETLTIPAGQTSGLIQIPLIDDALDEPSETFTLTLHSETN